MKLRTESVLRGNNGINLAKHGVSGTDYMTKFGYNSSVGTSEEPIWAESGTSYTYPSEATAMTVSSANANDTSAGTGARTVYVEGLDGNYDVISETATLNGQTAVNLSNSYLRVYRCYVATAGSGGKNAGIVYVGYGNLTSGKPATVQASIIAGANQTLQAIYTMPANKIGFLTNVKAASNGKGEIRVYTRNFGSVFRIQRNYPITDDIDREFYVPLVLQPKTDVEIRGLADTSTDKMGASFVILMEG